MHHKNLEGISKSKFTHQKNNNIFIIKIMPNQFTEYKTLLCTFSLQEQIDEINVKIKKLVNKKHIANINDRRYDRR